MMAILIVGADRLGNIPLHLHKAGAEEIIHWNGRKAVYQTKNIPKHVDQIILFCDFINHRLMYNIKRQAKALSIPIIFSKRSMTYRAS